VRRRFEALPIRAAVAALPQRFGRAEGERVSESVHLDVDERNVARAHDLETRTPVRAADEFSVPAHGK
jgi:hypothetical protein